MTIQSIPPNGNVWNVVKQQLKPGASNAEIQRATDQVLRANGLNWESAKQLKAGTQVDLSTLGNKQVAPKEMAAEQPNMQKQQAQLQAQQQAQLQAQQQAQLQAQQQAQLQAQQQAQLQAQQQAQLQAQQQAQLQAQQQAQQGSMVDQRLQSQGFGTPGSFERAAALANIDANAARQLAIGLLR